MVFCKTYKKRQKRDRTCHKLPPKPLGCSGWREGFVRSARVRAEPLGSWKLLLSCDRGSTWSRLCRGHSRDLQLVLHQHHQNAPYNQHQIAVMSKTVLPYNLSKARDFKGGKYTSESITKIKVSCAYATYAEFCCNLLRISRPYLTAFYFLLWAWSTCTFVLVKHS